MPINHSCQLNNESQDKHCVCFCAVNLESSASESEGRLQVGSPELFRNCFYKTKPLPPFSQGPNDQILRAVCLWGSHDFRDKLRILSVNFMHSMISERFLKEPEDVPRRPERALAPGGRQAIAIDLAVLSTPSPVPVGP